MDKKVKTWAVVLGVIIVLGIVFYSGSASLFQGRLDKDVKPLPSYDENKCIDSDGGKNYDEVGTVFGKISRSKSGSKSDFCSTDTELTEYYCNGKFIQSEEYSCENECGDGVCKKVLIKNDDYCNQKSFKSAFILLYENEDQLTQDALWKITEMKNGFAEAFNVATGNLASMQVDDDVIKMETNDNFFFMPEKNGNAQLELDYVVKEFYKSHADFYDFLLIGTTFGGSEPAELIRITNDILGIGIDDEIDISAIYGSSGYLKGVINLHDVNHYLFAEDTNPQNLILHEVGHQWCCFVGDNMQGGANGAKLEIIHDGMHFYRGLSSPYDQGTPLFSQKWISNGDGTFSVDFSKEYNGELKKFHPFVLYFMGLLPKEEYSTEYSIYDAGYAENPGAYYDNFNYDNATFYKTVSVNDIIAVEGERKCK